MSSSCESIAGQNSPGVFITFEGGEAAGKSTHIKFLASVLEDAGISVLRLREPGGTSIGEQLRAIVLDKANSEMTSEAELLIYEASRAQLMGEVIKPALKRGTVVLCDRFTDSTVVYQGHGRGLSVPFIESANSFATGGVAPDKTIVMYCKNTQESSGRLASREDTDRLEQAGDSFHDCVNAQFLSLALQYPDRVHLVETSGRHSETAKEIFKVLEPLFPWLTERSPELYEKLKRFDEAHHVSHLRTGE